MIVTGAQVLGSLNKPSTTTDAIGYSFWQVVVAAGVVCFIMGFANIAASYLFRTRSVGVTARMNISAPVMNDPEQFAKFNKRAADIERPEMAAHPAFQGGRF